MFDIQIKILNGKSNKVRVRGFDKNQTFKTEASGKYNFINFKFNQEIEIGEV